MIFLKEANLFVLEGHADKDEFIWPGPQLINNIKGGASK